MDPPRSQKPFPAVLVFTRLLPNFLSMLADRSYMRRDYPRRETSAVVWLVAALVASYCIELFLVLPSLESSGGGTLQRLALSIRNLQAGRVWVLLTHSLVHSPVNPFHILFVLLGLVFVGREVEPLLGGRRLMAVFFGSVVMGGLWWTAAHWSQGGTHVGASAGVLGLFVVLACLYPNQEFNFLVFFLFPVTVRPRYLIYGLLLLNACGLVFFEIPGNMGSFDYSPSVQLGGMLTGWLYFRFFHANNGWDRAPSISLPAWLKRSGPKAAVSADSAGAKPIARSGDLRAEVDQILDKINSQGFGSLTDDEKRVLDEAKDMLSRTSNH